MLLNVHIIGELASKALRQEKVLPKGIPCTPSERLETSVGQALASAGINTAQAAAGAQKYKRRVRQLIAAADIDSF